VTLKALDIKSVKQLNAGLAASAIQGDRDRALDKLIGWLDTNKLWFLTDAESKIDKKPVDTNDASNQHSHYNKSTRCLRMVWEGLFFSKSSS
jgi:hypothetical protein